MGSTALLDSPTYYRHNVVTRNDSGIMRIKHGVNDQVLTRTGQCSMQNSGQLSLQIKCNKERQLSVAIRWKNR